MAKKYPLTDRQIAKECDKYSYRLRKYLIIHMRGEGWFTLKQAMEYVKDANKLLNLLRAKKYLAAQRFYNRSAVSNNGYPMPVRLIRYFGF